MINGGDPTLIPAARGSTRSILDLEKGIAPAEDLYVGEFATKD